MAKTEELSEELQRISVLIIGDEILNGKIQDINAHTLGKTLRSWGTQLHKVAVVGDELLDIVEGLRDLQASSQIILISGGLGPTQDDKTRYALAEYLGVGGEYSEEARLWRQEFLAQQGKQDPENSVQNWIPHRCSPIKNPVGTACGILMEQEGTAVYAFPGVPKEFNRMVEDYVRPLVLGQHSWEEKKIWTWGWGESNQKDAFQDIEIPEPFVFSSLPRAQGVVISLGYSSSNVSSPSVAKEYQEFWDKIVSRIPKESIVDEQGADVLEKVYATLLEQKAHVATAESCTGGGIGQLLTSVPGISSVYEEGYITYSNAVKKKVLGVREETLREHGAVSRETVREMVLGTLEKSSAQYACAVSGIAGPGGGNEEKPVGTVWMAVGDKHGIMTEKKVFAGDREQVRSRSAYYTLHLLRKYLCSKK